MMGNVQSDFGGLWKAPGAGDRGLLFSAISLRRINRSWTDLGDFSNPGLKT